MAENILIKVEADNKGLTDTITLLEKLGQIDKKTADEFRAANKAYEDRAKATDKVNESTKNLGTESEKTGKKVNDSFKDAGKGLDSLSGTLKNIGGAIAGAFAVNQLISFGKEAINLSAKFNSVQNALNFIQGGAEKGGQAFQYLRDLSQRLGLELVSTAEAFKLFSASAQLGGVSADETQKIFTSVAEATTALGLSADDTKGVFLALSQIISKGTVQAEELRGQIGERLPGAFELAAKSMGVTTQELNKLLQQGKVTAKDFLPNFAATLKETFSGALPEAVNGARANLNRMSNAFTEFSVKVGNVLNTAIGSTFKFFDSLGPQTDKLIGEYRAQSSELGKLEKNIAPLLDRYDELKSKTTLNVNEQTELNGIIKTVGDTLPTAIDGFDKYGNAISLSTTAARELIQAQKDLTAFKNAEAIASATTQLKTYQSSVDGLIAALNKGGVEVTNLTTGVSKFEKFSPEKVNEYRKTILRLNEQMRGLSLFIKELKGETLVDDAATQKSIEQIGVSIDSLKLKLASLQKDLGALLDLPENDAARAKLIQDIVDTNKEIERLSGKLRDEQAKKENDDRQKSLDALNELERKASDDLLAVKAAEIDKVAELELKKQQKIKEINEAFAKAGSPASELKDVAKAIDEVNAAFDILIQKEVEAQKEINIKVRLSEFNDFSDKVDELTKQRELDIKIKFIQAGDFSDSAFEKMQKEIENISEESFQKLLKQAQAYGLSKEQIDTLILEHNIKTINDGVDAVKNGEDEKAKAAKKSSEERMAIEQGVIDFIKGSLSLLGDAANNYYSAELDMVERQKQSVLDAYDEQAQANEDLHQHNMRGDRQYEKEKKKIDAERKKAEEKADKEKRKLLHDQAVLNKELAIANSIINTAVAVTANLAVPVVAALVAILGAAEVAVIASQPIPAYAKGKERIEGKGTETSDDIHARLSVGERVVKASTNRKYFPVLSAIHHERLDAESMNHLAKMSPDALRMLVMVDKGVMKDLATLSPVFMKHESMKPVYMKKDSLSSAITYNQTVINEHKSMDEYDMGRALDRGTKIKNARELAVSIGKEVAANLETDNSIRRRI